MTEGKTAFGRFVRQRRKLLIVLLVAIVAGVAVFFVLGQKAPAAGAEPAMPAMTALAKMDLEESVTATGTLQSTKSTTVSSALSYEIAEVKAAVGDHVTAGQVLAQLDGSELESEIASLRESIAETNTSNSLKLSQAERKLQDAVNDRAINEANNSSQKQTALEQQEAAQAALEKAEAAQAKAKTAYEKKQAAVADVAPETYADDAAYQAALSAAQKEAEAAAQALEEAKKATETREQELKQAKESYENAVASQESQYRNDSINIENAQDSVNTQKVGGDAGGTSGSEEDQLEQALEDQNDLIITAPVSGTITEVNAEVGDTPGSSAGGENSSNALFVIQDTESLELSATVAEYDMVNIAEGMAARVTSDALDGEEWQGTVSSISPTATDDNGNFTITVGITSPVGQLRVGMTARVEIVLAASSDVYAVPYDAVTQNEAGESVVYAWEEGERRAVPVEVGMETDYYVEISGDELAEGMMILTDPEGNSSVVVPSEDAPESMPEGVVFEMGGGVPGGGTMPGGAAPAGGGPPS